MKNVLKPRGLMTVEGRYLSYKLRRIFGSAELKTEACMKLLRAEKSNYGSVSPKV